MLATVLAMLAMMLAMMLTMLAMLGADLYMYIASTVLVKNSDALRMLDAEVSAAQYQAYPDNSLVDG